ncbi:MAG: hypothetical protein L0Y71_09180 [Gemmataceae bacterium]|nr:hypothetical protein [Gemmataceae bacterium]
MFRCWLLMVSLLIAANGAASAQAPQDDAPITFDVNVVPADPFDLAHQRGAASAPMKVRRGQAARVVIEGRLKPGYYTYPLTKRTGLQSPVELWKYTPAETPGLAPLWPVVETEPTQLDVDDLLSKLKRKITVLEHKHDFTWIQDVLVLPEAKPGMIVLPIKLFGQVCDEKNCNRKDYILKATFDVSPEEPVAVDPAVAARLTAAKPNPSVVIIKGQEPPPEIAAPAVPGAAPSDRGGGHEKTAIFSPLDRTPEEYQAAMEALAGQIAAPKNGMAATGTTADLWSFILAGIFWGAVSLITPCVFPMIPITVSFFLKQSEKEHHEPVTMALVYSATIVIVLTLAAAFLLSVFRWLSVNPIMNYGLGLLFVFFALSLFGMYDIELPSGLARFTSQREGQGGIIGTVFMALTFTIISFACVAPFLGGFGGTAAGTARPWWHNILGGLAFSVTFAAPFFVLALFPTMLRKMPKSGNWLNSVKVVMGFLELAAAFKFFRSAELVLTGASPWLFTFDFVMGIYVTLCILCGLYLLGVYRLPHDTPEEHLGVVRMLFAGLFLALGVYFMPALFKHGPAGEPQRPSGTLYAWVDSFLLPDTNRQSEGAHTANLPAAVAEAIEHYQKTGQPKHLFVDFTGVTCTNCSINERDVFTKPEIKKLFEPYLMVKLYSDTVPREYYTASLQSELGKTSARQEADAFTNLRFQRKVFNTEQLPLYALLEPQVDGSIQVLSVYPEGRINNIAAFADFLRNQK